MQSTVTSMEDLIEQCEKSFAVYKSEAIKKTALKTAKQKATMDDIIKFESIFKAYTDEIFAYSDQLEAIKPELKNELNSFCKQYTLKMIELGYQLMDRL